MARVAGARGRCQHGMDEGNAKESVVDLGSQGCGCTSQARGGCKGRTALEQEGDRKGECCGFRTLG